MFLSLDYQDSGVISPLSIGVAFGMADVGAGEMSGGDLARLFGFGPDASGGLTDDAQLSAFNTLLQDITADGEGILNGPSEGPPPDPVVVIANRQFPDESFDPIPTFSDAIATWFGALAQPLPLQADPDGSRQVINRYVGERTRDVIPELLPRGAITRQSILVLVNALYLEAAWERPFGGKYATTAQPFTDLAGTESPVQLMHDAEAFGPAVDGGDYVAAEVPYAGGELSMLLIVPDDGAFGAVRDRLAEGLLEEIDAGGTPRAIDLYLPVFSTTTPVNLATMISEDLGFSNIFSGDYPGIADGIALTGAIHTADIQVDEAGTVAAAATALMFEESGPPEPEITVRADRPFLYAVRHQPSGAILFLGQLTSTTE
ncbi:serpin family protein [Euzebya tangerina]|uniref:serpin family protein n=1 Tax=Euzebya tangerina TaxID=591198 RepID=UPI0013C2F83E|nr:serpin family protein [Euzebya tangerina]